MATADEPDIDKGVRAAKTMSGEVTMPDGGYLSRTPGGALPKDRAKKLGHRRVNEKTGTVTYKKKPTSELMAAIQLGIGQSVGGLTSKPERDLLMQDFAVVQSVFFPSEGSNMTPAHHCSDFRLKTYAPLAFRYFRELFNIRPDDFMLSLCDESLTELSNPGAGGSIFYISADDEFIIKTAQHKEAGFLVKLLPGYYMNLNQNPRTLLPKFYALFCYQCGGKNIRFVVMNNILPQQVKFHEKYDLKGSTYKRKASKAERAKSSPTWKDLDFVDLHPEGFLLEKETYEALMKTILRDCRVLESFKIMDYSLLMGVHNLDQAERERFRRPEAPGTSSLADSHGSNDFDGKPKAVSLTRGKSIRTKVTQYSTPMESIQADVPTTAEEFDDDDIPPGGIPAKNSKGDRLLLFIGIIDILQCYRLRKKMEHTFKSMLTDGDTVSVTRPSYYADRFQKFFENQVFRKAPSPLKHSPSKRKPGERGYRTTSMSEDTRGIPGTMGGRPDLLIDSSTPPPTFAEALATGTQPRVSHQSPHSPAIGTSDVHSLERTYFQTIQQQEVLVGGVRVRHSPLSVSESTPTYTDFTEGTPSYTPSSPSCSSEVLDTTIPNLSFESNPAIDAGSSTETSPAKLSASKLSVENSPSKVMVTSSSTDTSYVSAHSTIENSQSDRENGNKQTFKKPEDRQFNFPNPSDNVTQRLSAGRTVAISVQSMTHDKAMGEISNNCDSEPRISVVSQKSSDTSFSTYTNSSASGYTESIISASTDPSVVSGQSESTDMSWNYNEEKDQIRGKARVITEVEESTHL